MPHSLKENGNQGEIVRENNARCGRRIAALGLTFALILISASVVGCIPPRISTPDWLSAGDVEGDSTTLSDANQHDLSDTTADSMNGEEVIVPDTSDASTTLDQQSCSDADDCDASQSCDGGSDGCGGCTEQSDCAHLTTTCTVGVCNMQTLACEAKPTNESGVCNDGNQCTSNDRCQSGVCKGDPDFGASCGIGGKQMCDGYGHCRAWTLTELTMPPPKDAITCATHEDCDILGTGYLCDRGLCGCRLETCDCGSSATKCSQFSHCVVRPDAGQPDGRRYACTFSWREISALCTNDDSSETNRLFGLVVQLEYPQPGQPRFQLDALEIEQGAIVGTSTLVADPTFTGGLYPAALRCANGRILLQSQSGPTYSLRYSAAELSWLVDDSIVTALAQIGGSTLTVSAITVLEAAKDGAGKQVYYIAGDLSAVLLGPSDTNPTEHRDFVARCVEDEFAPSGFVCAPVFFMTHDGITKFHTEILPAEYVRPPYDQASLRSSPWLIKAIPQGNLEQLYLALHAWYYETIPGLQDPVRFSYSGIVGGSNLSPSLRYDAPLGCLQLQGPCRTTGSSPADMNGGLRDLASRGSRLLMTAAPAAPHFDSDLRAIRMPTDNLPALGKLLRNDGTGWVAVELPTNGLPSASDELSEAPYDYMLDRVRFVSDDTALVVGHYRTCLTAGCLETMGANTVTLRVQPFVTTFRFSSSTYGAVQKLGSPMDLTCCVGDGCTKEGNCFGHTDHKFLYQHLFQRATVQQIGFRKRTDGIEIFLLRNRLVVYNANSWEPWPVAHEVFTFISTEN